MTDEARAALREYKRKWRAKNKEKIKAYNDQYWQRKADEMKRQEERSE